jgi:chorismate mutase
MKTNDEEHPDINELRALWCEEKSKSMTFHAEVERLRADLATRTAERDALAAEVAALKAQADPQTDAQVQEQVASIVYAAMRFAREDVTPEWQAGNSHAEYRARQAATEIASMLRCALKAHDPLAEMWRELEKRGGGCAASARRRRRWLRRGLRHGLRRGLRGMRRVRLRGTRRVRWQRSAARRRGRDERHRPHLRMR